MAWIYQCMDIFFVVFHSLVIVFNLFGWIWKKTRMANLILLLLTASSWLFLGWIVGVMGYCPLTDWHFRVLEKMGKTGLPGSYVKYLADRLSGLEFSAVVVDRITLIAFLAALVCSLFFTARDRIKFKRYGG